MEKKMHMISENRLGKVLECREKWPLQQTKAARQVCNPRPVLGWRQQWLMRQTKEKSISTIKPLYNENWPLCKCLFDPQWGSH